MLPSKSPDTDKYCMAFPYVGNPDGRETTEFVPRGTNPVAFEGYREDYGWRAILTRFSIWSDFFGCYSVL